MGGLVTGLFQKNQDKIAPSGPDPEMVKAQKEQEARLEAREAQSQRELAARKRARRTGGNRALMAQRDNPFLGVPSQTTLGPAPFSRSQSGTNY
jgi:hypothetical protein